MTQSQTGRLLLVLFVLASIFASTPYRVTGQESGEDGQTQEPTDELALKQSHLADKYQQLEMLMLKMAEFDTTSNPRRSALLKRALAQSKEQHIRLQMDQLVKLIQKQQLARAIDDQGQVQKDLQALLELLLSEDRADRNKDEQDRVREYIKEVDRVLRQHRSVQGRTEGGGDPNRLAELQRKVADRANRLHKLIESNERPGEGEPSEGQPSEGQPSEGQPSEGQPSEGQPSEGQPSEGQPSEGQPSEGQPSEGQPSEGQPSEGQPSEGQPSEGQPSEGQPSEGQPSEGQPSEGQPSEGQPSEGQPSEGQPSEGQPSEGQPSEGQPSEGQPSEGQPSEGQPSEGQPSQGQPSQGQPGEGQSGEQQQPQQQEAFPGQKRIAEAEQRMREAQQRLEEAKRKEANEPQEEARRLLEQAKAELEEILRQLREEEIERTLAMLESRFRKMLEMQLKVYDDSRRLSQIPLNKRNSQVDIQAGKLSVQERRIAGEADKALLLLREEGSSVAFPEAVEQMHADMLQVAERLSRTRLDRITLGLEEDIIAALEEMVEALQKAQQEAQQRRQQQQQQQQGGGQQDQPLVDAIAELKMIRALQMRVNKRTQRYARLLDEPDSLEGQATDEDLLDSLGRLSEREQSIRRVTRDIVLGKNR